MNMTLWNKMVKFYFRDYWLLECYAIWKLLYFLNEYIEDGVWWSSQFFGQSLWTCALAQNKWIERIIFEYFEMHCYTIRYTHILLSFGFLGKWRRATERECRLFIRFCKQLLLLLTLLTLLRRRRTVIWAWTLSKLNFTHLVIWNCRGCIDKQFRRFCTSFF